MKSSEVPQDGNPLLGGERKLSYAVDEDTLVGLSLSRTERPPVGDELYADGPHFATASFERGDGSVDEETAWGIELTAKRRQGPVTGAVNRVAATGTVTDGPTTFEIRRHVTWSPVTVDGSRVDRGYKQATVIVSWTDPAGDHQPGRDTDVQIELRPVAQRGGQLAVELRQQAERVVGGPDGPRHVPDDSTRAWDLHGADRLDLLVEVSPGQKLHHQVQTPVG